MPTQDRRNRKPGKPFLVHVLLLEPSSVSERVHAWLVAHLRHSCRGLHSTDAPCAQAGLASSEDHPTSNLEAFKTTSPTQSPELNALTLPEVLDCQTALAGCLQSGL